MERSGYYPADVPSVGYIPWPNIHPDVHAGKLGGSTPGPFHVALPSVRNTCI